MNYIELDFYLRLLSRRRARHVGMLKTGQEK